MFLDIYSLRQLGSMFTQSRSKEANLDKMWLDSLHPLAQTITVVHSINL